MRNLAFRGLRLPRLGAMSGFNPASLFGNGVWLDRSDIFTLFQDAAGSTPVTAATQLDALKLDKSQGLVVGPQLVANGDFANGATGWSVSAQSSIVGGVARIVSTDGSFQQVAQSKTFGIGTYELKFDVTARTSGAVSFSFSGAGVNIGSVASAVGSYKLVFFVAAEVSSTLAFFRAGVTDISIDNVSVRLLPGNHATQATAAKRPTYQTSAGLHWLAFDGVDDAMATAAIDFTGTDAITQFAGLRSLAAVNQIVAELSANAGGNNGTFQLAKVSTKWQAFSRGTIGRSIQTAIETTLSTRVVTQLADISQPFVALRIDGVVAIRIDGVDAADQGTGNYGNYVLNIGARDQASIFFNGNIYGLIIPGKLASAAEIASTEAYMAAKTGVLI